MKKEKKTQVLPTALDTAQTNGMPMINQVVENFITFSRHAISQFLNSTFEINLDGIVSIEKKDYLPVIESNTDFISSTISINEFNSNPIYLLIGKDFLYKVIEIAMGGQSLESSLEVKNRDFSKIEQSLIVDLLHVINSKLQSALRLVDSHITLSHGRTNYKHPEVVIQFIDKILLIRTSIQIKDCISKMDIVIPHDALLPIKTSLMKSFSNTKLTQSNQWKNHVSDFVLDIPVELRVEIQVEETLSAIQQIKVGDTILTDKDASEPFELRVNGVKIHSCRIGKMSEKIAIELIDDSSR